MFRHGSTYHNSVALERRRRPLVWAVTLALMLSAGVVVAPVSTPPAAAVGSYDNAKIADEALKYAGSLGKNGQWGGNACKNAQRSGYWDGTPGGQRFDGQCRAFVNCIVWIASGKTQWLGGGGGDYFNRLAALGKRITSVDELRKGDIVQRQPDLHTFIIVKRISASTFRVVDSNADGTNERVKTYDRPVSLSSTTRAYRLGTVKSTPDGEDDVLHATGMSEYGWRMKWSGNGAWVQVSSSTTTKPSLAIGDFNGDGRDDVLRAGGSDWGWKVKWSGKGAWVTRSSSTTTMGSLLVGDFNGDGKDDVLHATGLSEYGWRVKWSGNGAWVQVSSSTTTKPSLAIGDFNGDGRDDVLRAGGSDWGWKVKWSGKGAWVTRSGSTTTMGSLLVGDFDG